MYREVILMVSLWSLDSAGYLLAAQGSVIAAVRSVVQNTRDHGPTDASGLGPKVVDDKAQIS
jgi:hypothetical protein